MAQEICLLTSFSHQANMPKNYYKIYSMHCIMVFTYEQRKFGQTKFHLLPRIQHWAVFNLKKDTWALAHSNLMLGSTRFSALFNYHTIPSTNFYQDTGTQIKMSIYISHINTLSSLYIHINQYVPQHFVTSVCLDIALQLELYCLSQSFQFYQLTILIQVFSMEKVASKSEHGNETLYMKTFLHKNNLKIMRFHTFSTESVLSFPSADLGYIMSKWAQGGIQNKQPHCWAVKSCMG